MKYWVYINNKVTGPFAEDKLVTLDGFTPDTLICSEEAANSGNQEWAKASTIFEFEQPAPAPVAAQAAPAAGGNDALTAMLLAKIDALTNQLAGMQSKLEGMQSKLDESIISQQKAAEEVAARTEALSEQVTQITFIKPEDPKPQPVTNIPTENLDDNEDNLEHTIPASDVFVQPAEEPAPQETQPEELSPSAEPLKADEPAKEEESADNAPAAEDDLLGNKEGEDVVLSSALDSLHSKVHGPAKEEDDKEATFQDLLTPSQADSLTKDQPSKTDEQKKEEILSQITEAPKDDVIDQVIKEKEEEKEKTEKPSSVTMRILAGAAALAGAVGLKKKNTQDDKKDSDTVSLSQDSANPEDLPVLETKTEEQPAAQPEELPAEKQPLEFDDVATEEPALSVSEAQPAETPAQDEQPQQTPDLQDLAANEPTAEEAATQEAHVEPAPAAQEADAQVTPEENAVDKTIPTLEASEAPVGESFIQEQEDESPQELVPNAQADKPEDIISEADLKEAFAERKNQEENSVEQLFGLASAGAAVSSAAEQTPAEQTPDYMPSLDDAAAQQGEPKQTGTNPNELTEVELKAGSTYLISDFVPPASSNPNAAIEQAFTSDQPTEPEQQDDSGLEEMVTNVTAAQKNEQTEQKAEEGVSDVTVSQIVLENTIKAKRGAALDIKTVPMVPEPADSDRLQVDGLDDLNTQHDLKSADLEPAGKKTKIFLGLVVMCLLAGAIYAMLAWMNIGIPPQFNVFAKRQAAAAAQQQDAQLNEMLGPTEEQLPVQTVDENTPVGVENPQDAILEEVKNYMLPNGQTLKAFVEAKHPAATDLITWEISTAVDPDNYSILVKVPPENPQSFKISYRFNYNTVTKVLDPTISDAKNLLDSAQPQGDQPQPVPAPAGSPAQ